MIRCLIFLSVATACVAAGRADEFDTRQIAEADLATVQQMLIDLGPTTDPTWEKTADIKVPRVVVNYGFSPDGDAIYCAGSLGLIQAWRISTGEQLASFRVEGKLFKVAMTPDEKYMLVGGDFGEVHVYESASGEKVFSHDAFKGGILDVQVSVDGQYMTAADKAGTLCRYPVLGGQGWTLKAGPDFEPVRAFAATADASSVTFACIDNTCGHVIWPSESGEQVLNDFGGQLNTSAVLAAGTNLTITYSNAGRWGSLLERSPDGQFHVQGCNFHAIPVRDLQVSSDDKLIASATRVGHLHLVSNRVRAITPELRRPPMFGSVRTASRSRSAGEHTYESGGCETNRFSGGLKCMTLATRYCARKSLPRCHI